MKQKNKQYTKSIHSRKIHSYVVFCVVAVLIISAIATALYIKSTNDTTAGKQKNAPTEEEIKTADANKNTIVASQKNASQAEITKNTEESTTSNNYVNVVIVDAAQYDSIIEVRSFAEGLYTNATCTILFAKGSETVEKQTPAFADASTTICTNPEISRAEFSSGGEWRIEVSFTADGASGISNAQKIIIK